VSHALNLSDEIYTAIAELARARGTTPEVLAEELLREHLAEHDAIARQNAEWSAGLDEDIARAVRGENPHYASLEDFFAALNATPEHPDEGTGK
jgi:hypothetical protein